MACQLGSITQSETECEEYAMHVHQEQAPYHHRVSKANWSIGGQSLPCGQNLHVTTPEGLYPFCKNNVP